MSGEESKSANAASPVEASNAREMSSIAPRRLLRLSGSLMNGTTRSTTARSPSVGTMLQSAAKHLATA